MTNTGMETALALIDDLKGSIQGYNGVISSKSVEDMLDDIKAEINNTKKNVEVKIQETIQKNSAGLVYDPTTRRFIKSK
jgi:hypothetical protein